MPICREGHTSATADYCDECGAPIAARSEPAGAAAGSGNGRSTPDGPAEHGGSGPAAAEACPVCGAPRSGRFCEEDGYDFVLRPPVPEPVASGADAAAPPDLGAAPEAAPEAASEAASEAAPSAPEAATPVPVEAAGGALVAVIVADRSYYETVMAQHGPDAASIAFPAFYPERRITLTGTQVLIGRHSTSRGINPQIDLSGPPEDPGVSHVHAVLQPTADGGWTVTDPGSTNGTTVNDDPRPIDVGVPRPVRAGDEIHVGAWTTITLRPGPA